MLQTRWSRLKQEEKGAILPFLALLIPVFVLLVGIILDVGRAYVIQHQLQNIVDASALAGANQAITISDGINQPYAVIPAEGEQAARKYFNDNFNAYMKGKAELVGLTFNPLVGNLNYTEGKIHVEATVKIPLTVARMVGINYFEVTRDSWAIAIPK